ncbi:phosphoenolpyruvate carboxylase, partial [bacterium]|nr:phosphoenolpyruvate carboxylase [bacterium]
NRLAGERYINAANRGEGDELLEGVAPHFRTHIVMTAHPTQNLSNRMMWLIFDIQDLMQEYAATGQVSQRVVGRYSELNSKMKFDQVLDALLDQFVMTDLTHYYYDLPVDAWVETDVIALDGHDYFLKPGKDPLDLANYTYSDIYRAGASSLGNAAYEAAQKNQHEYSLKDALDAHPEAVIIREQIARELQERDDQNRAGDRVYYRGKDWVIPDLGKPTTKLTVNGEVRRAADFALEIIGAVPELMKRYVQAENRLDQRYADDAPQNKQMGGQSFAERYRLFNQQNLYDLSVFDRLLQIDSWAGGDRDNKDNVTAVEIEKAIYEYRDAATGFYRKSLQDIIQQAGQSMFQALSGMANQEIVYLLTKDDAFQPMAGAIRGRLADIAAEAKTKGFTTLDELLERYAAGEKGLPSLANMVTDAFMANLAEWKEAELSPILTDNKAFVEKLDAWRQWLNPYLPEIATVQLPNNEGIYRMTTLDALRVQAANMRGYAAHPQLRQNRDRHNVTYDYMVAEGWLTPESLTGGIAALTASDPDFVRDAEKAVGEWIDANHQNDEKADILESLQRIDGVLPKMEYLLRQRELEPEFAEHVMARCLEVSDEYASNLRSTVAMWLDGVGQEIAQNKHVPKEKRLAYETLKSCWLANEYPGAIEDYIIAECEGIHDILKVRLFLQATAHGDRPAVKTHIVPLFEGWKEIIDNKDITGDIFNEDWLAQLLDPVNGQEENSKDRIHHAPLVYAIDPETKQSHPVTPNDILKAMGIDSEFATRSPGHEKGGLGVSADILNRPLEKKQTVMYAGSDSIKSSGACIVPLLERAKEHAILQGLRHGVLVQLYAGEGGSVFRKDGGLQQQATFQGVSLMWEGLRQVVADRVEATQVNNILQYFSGNTRATMQKGTGKTQEVVIGNQLLQPREGEPQWKEIKERCTNGVHYYRKIFGERGVATDFGEYFQEGAAHKLVSAVGNHSARKDSRDRVEPAAGEVAAVEEKPKEVVQKHQDSRAIGYNLALNVAGSCAPLYIGVGKALAGTISNSMISTMFHGNPDEISQEDAYHAMLGGNLNGLIEQTFNRDNLEKLEILTQASPKFQEMLLRSAYALVMANFDVAWKGLGGQLDQQTNKVSFDEGKTWTHVTKLVEHERGAVRQLAYFQLEHALCLPVVRALLHDLRVGHGEAIYELNGIAYPGGQMDFNGAEMFDHLRQVHRSDLYDELAPGLKVELGIQMQNADRAREYLLQFKDGKNLAPDSPNYRDAHAAFTACVGIFERAPVYFHDATFNAQAVDEMLRGEQLALTYN